MTQAAKHQRLRCLRYSVRSWQEIISSSYFWPVLPLFPVYDLYPSSSNICPHRHSSFPYISVSFPSFACLLISPFSYKPSHMGFCPCSSLLCFQVGLHSSLPGPLSACREDTRVIGGASILVCFSVYFTMFVVLYPMLPHSQTTRKLQGSPLSSGIRVGVWAFVDENGMCLVLHTQKSSVKDRGRSVESTPLEELLQNNEEQQVILEAKVRMAVLETPVTLQLVNANRCKRSVQKLAWWLQSKRISEACWGLHSQHHTLCIAPMWSSTYHLGTHILMF